MSNTDGKALMDAGDPQFENLTQYDTAAEMEAAAEQARARLRTTPRQTDPQRGQRFFAEAQTYIENLRLMAAGKQSTDSLTLLLGRISRTLVTIAEEGLDVEVFVAELRTLLPAVWAEDVRCQIEAVAAYDRGKVARVSLTSAMKHAHTTLMNAQRNNVDEAITLRLHAALGQLRALLSTAVW